MALIGTTCWGARREEEGPLMAGEEGMDSEEEEERGAGGDREWAEEGGGRRRREIWRQKKRSNTIKLESVSYRSLNYSYGSFTSRDETMLYRTHDNDDF